MFEKSLFSLFVSTLVLILGLSCPKAAHAQTIRTFAGTGTSGFSGDAGQALAANLSQSFGIAIDAQGNGPIPVVGVVRIAVGSNPEVSPRFRSANMKRIKEMGCGAT